MAAVLAGANPSGKYLFIDTLPHKENELKNAIEYFGGRFVKLGELADIRDEHDEKIRVGSHGFGRHSFVLMCLNSDMPTHDIATLPARSITSSRLSACLWNRQVQKSYRYLDLCWLLHKGAAGFR